MLFPPLFNALTSIARFTPGEMPLFGSDVCVPALLGMEYPDPMGSGLSVPVLGCQTDLVSGRITPLAGTMEDPDGKGKEENNKSPDIVHLKSTLRLYETIQNKDSCTLFFHVAPHRPGGNLLRVSDCRPRDGRVDPSGWRQA